MSQTLATAEALAIWQDFYRPSSSPSSGLGGNDIDEIRVLIMLGSGMDCHLHIADGGVVATLLGEAMGTRESFNRGLHGTRPDFGKLSKLERKVCEKWKHRWGGNRILKEYYQNLKQK